jgi:hypothetical protein
MITTMKTALIQRTLPIAVLLIAVTAGADEISTNRLTFSARFGFNMSAKFKGVPVTTTPTPSSVSGRTTPQGDAYNYDDGYVLKDISDNYGGQTWYWGYDNKAAQVSGDTILLSKTTAASSGSGSDSMEDDPYYGGEISYQRLLMVKGATRIGIEVAANYMNMCLSQNQTLSGNTTIVTDAYPFTPGTTPPTATTSDPYQGSFGGPGFVIGGTPVDSTTAILAGTSIEDHQSFDANLWGFRLGPYLEWPMSERWNVSVCGGLAVGLLDANASWKQTSGSAVTKGSGSDWEVLWGCYAGANVAYQFAENWSVVGGAQYQYLGDYEHSFGGRKVEVDFTKSIFVTIGLSWTF